MHILQWVLLAAVVVLNIAATIEILMSAFLSTWQRGAWLAFVWLVPILGSGVCLVRAWRNHRGLDRSLGNDLMSDVPELFPAPKMNRSSGRSSGGLGDDADD